jgi:hypothetical protein
MSVPLPRLRTAAGNGRRLVPRPNAPSFPAAMAVDFVRRHYDTRAVEAPGNGAVPRFAD